MEDGKGFDCVDEGGGVSVPDVDVADYDVDRGKGKKCVMTFEREIG